jgi:rubrerythrin
MEQTKVTPLEFALDFEAKGTSMYLELAKKTINPLGKKLFYSLAMEEVAHAQKIDEISMKLKSQTGASSLGDPALPGVEEQLKEFFKNASKQELSKGSEDIKGYELAMEMERKGYKTYNDFMVNAKSDTEKQFFQALLGEEKKHLEALSNVYNYLTKTGDWLQEEESKVWNWMNF